MKIAFDVGGVLSKYPRVFDDLIMALAVEARVDVYIISDIHPREKILKMLEMNGFDYIHPNNVYSADYKTYGERCKSVLCEGLGIDILIDDFPAYVSEGKHVRLLVMPNPAEPYYADEWKTDGSEGDFGRRVRVQ